MESFALRAFGAATCTSCATADSFWRGTSSSDCSNPSVAMMRIFAFFIFGIDTLLEPSELGGTPRPRPGSGPLDGRIAAVAHHTSLHVTPNGVQTIFPRTFDISAAVKARSVCVWT